MIRALRLLIAPAFLAIAQPGVGQSSPMVFPHVIDDARCAPSSAADNDVTVCGRRRETDRYRVPIELRDNRPIDARNESPVAAQREERSLDRFSAQTVGPGGYLQHSRQIDCEWRAARQTLQGRQPDCTVRIGPDEPTDWRRR
jgi:hypothetical protein